MNGCGAVDLLSSFVLDTGQRWGECAMAWQRADADAVLHSPSDGPFLHWLGRPKGGSKSTDLAGMCCAWLLDQAAPMDEGFAVAADEEQANRLLDKARGIVARTPGLAGHLKIEAKRIINPANGARVQALAADVSGSEGLLTPWIVVDELPNWPTTAAARRMWTSIFSAVPKWPGMRLVVIGHAGDPAHWSYKVLERARVSPRWRVVEIPGPLDWISPDDLEEQKAMLFESEYQRRHLNLWVSGEDRLTTVDDINVCVTHTGPLTCVPGRRYAVALDLGLKRDRTVLTVCHTEPMERAVPGRPVRVVVDRQLVWQGTRERPVSLDEVESACRQAHNDYGNPRFVVDPWQSAQLTERLRGQGVSIEEYLFSAQSVGRLAQRLYLLLRDRALGLPDDAELLDELANVRLR